MPNLNEVDILESVFAIVAGVVLSEGKIDESDISATRAIAEPSLFSLGKYSKTISVNSKRQVGDKPADIFTVELDYASAGSNDSNEISYRSARDIGDIENKIDYVLSQCYPNKSTKFKNLLAIRDSYLDDAKEETLVFTVNARGTGEKVISLTIEVTSPDGTEVAINDTFSFNLPERQVDSEVYDNIITIANTFGVELKRLDRFEFAKIKAYTYFEKQRKYELLQKMYSELLMLIGQYKVNVSQRAFSFIEAALYGDSLNFIDTTKVNTRTISQSFLNTLKSFMKLNVYVVGRNIQFKDSVTGMVVFEMSVELKSMPDVDINFKLKESSTLYRVIKKINT